MLDVPLLLQIILSQAKMKVLNLKLELGEKFSKRPDEKQQETMSFIIKQV
jgi:hypothetical protein